MKTVLRISGGEIATRETTHSFAFALLASREPLRLRAVSSHRSVCWLGPTRGSSQRPRGVARSSSHVAHCHPCLGYVFDMIRRDERQNGERSVRPTLDGTPRGGVFCATGDEVRLGVLGERCVEAGSLSIGGAAGVYSLTIGICFSTRA